MPLELDLPSRPACRADELRSLEVCLEAASLSPRTGRAYASRIRQVLTQLRRPPDGVRPEEIALEIERLARSGAGGSAQAQTLAALRFYFRMVAPRPDVIRHLRTVPRAKGRPKAVLTPAQARALFMKCSNPRDRLLIGLLYGCGLRLGEALALGRDDVNLGTGTLRIMGPRARLTTVSPRVAPLLEAWVAEHGTLFAGRGGRVLSARGAEKALAGAGKRVGLPLPVTARLLRRSYAHHLQARGVAPDAIRRHLGLLGLGFPSEGGKRGARDRLLRSPL